MNEIIVHRADQRVCDRCGGTGLVRDDRAVGKTIRSKRERAGLTLRETARRMDMSPAYLSDLELGHRHWRPELEQAAREAIEAT